MRVFGGLMVCMVCLSAYAADVDFTGEVAVSNRGFLKAPLDDAQHRNYVELHIEPELFIEWDNGNKRVLIAPEFEWYQYKNTPEIQIKDLYIQQSFERWELSAGVRTFFWGVTESAHLVDIINQDDVRENLDGEDKLGQPMVHARRVFDNSQIDMFVMSYFEAREFVGEDFRLRPQVPITHESLYESGAERKHIDIAFRYSTILGDWDLGVAHFSGTARDPLFVQNPDSSLTPFYAQIEQTSIDVQGAKGDTLYKLEAVTGDRFDGRYSAFAFGLEHTLVGLFDTSFDLGIVAEYVFDDRSTFETFFNNDIAVGGRLVLNDAQSTEVLAFVGIDADDQARFTSIEGSRRLGVDWTIELEARFFSNTDESNLILNSLRDDDYLELTLARYF